MSASDVSESIDKSHQTAETKPEAAPEGGETTPERLKDVTIESTEVAEPADASKDSTEMDWEAFVENYQDYSYSPGGGGVRYGDDEMPTIEQTLASQSDLYDQLEAQLGVTPLTDPERECAERIIGNIDEAGYFNGDVLATTSVDAPFATVALDLDLARRSKATYPRYVPE